MRISALSLVLYPTVTRTIRAEPRISCIICNPEKEESSKATKNGKVFGDERQCSLEG